VVIQGQADARGRRFAVVVSQYNDFVTARLRSGAEEALAHAGAAPGDVDVIVVSGSYEIPQAARLAAATGRYDAVICLGCLIKGETPHFEYISSAVSHGIMSSALETGVPMTFGVLTTNSAEQALERVAPGPGNKGWEAAMAAVELSSIAGALGAPDGPAT
jgi:6,7-dimethyl-8-ribityllumazine synthase